MRLLLLALAVVGLVVTAFAVAYWQLGSTGSPEVKDFVTLTISSLALTVSLASLFRGDLLPFRLRVIAVEDANLKRMYLDLALENAAIEDVLDRKP
jgi:hypothetical protein